MKRSRFRQTLGLVAVILCSTAPPGFAQGLASNEVVLVGTVTGLLPAARSFFLTLSDGREIMVAAPSNAARTASGESAAFEDVRLFDRVTVRGTIVDSRSVTAQTIMIMPAMDGGKHLNH
jgi:hypothetical protein